MKEIESEPADAELLPGSWMEGTEPAHAELLPRSWKQGAEPAYAELLLGSWMEGSEPACAGLLQVGVDGPTDVRIHSALTKPMQPDF